MNTTTKAYMQALGITNKIEYIIATKTIIGKHNHLDNVQSSMNALFNKVKIVKDKFNELVKKVIPSFWDIQGYLICQGYCQALFVHKRNEDSNFNDLERHLKGQIIVDKLNDDFDILIYFKLLVKNFLLCHTCSIINQKY